MPTDALSALRTGTLWRHGHYTRQADREGRHGRSQSAVDPALLPTLSAVLLAVAARYGDVAVYL